MRIQSFFYADPDLYPPMINAAHVLHEQGIGYHITSRLYTAPVLPVNNALYPENTVVTRILPPDTNSLFQYLHFVATSLKGRSRQDDLIIGYDMHALLPAWLISTILRKPLIYHCHDFMDKSEAKSIGEHVVKWFERRIARIADAVIVPDTERAAIMVDQLHLPQIPIIAANASLTAPDQSSALQDTLAAQDKSFSRVIFRQGRIGPNHALDVTLRSMPMWKDPNWGFVIMGPADPAYRDHLLALADDLQISDRFVILPAVSYPEVAKYTVGAHLGHGLYEPTHFNHQYFTTASNKILEYFAAGLPIVMSESTGSQSLLEKYRVGITADIHSPASVAQAVNAILEDDERAGRMRAESRRAFAEEFNYTRQYAPVIARFQEIIAQKQHSPSKRMK